jgi:hypothetical protein
MLMYSNFKGGWKCSLQAAISHHNRSFCSSIGCSPHFALYGKSPADAEAYVDVSKIQTEKIFSREKEKELRLKQKTYFDRRHVEKITVLKEGNKVYIRKETRKFTDLILYLE